MYRGDSGGSGGGSGWTFWYWMGIRKKYYKYFVWYILYAHFSMITSAVQSISLICTCQGNHHTHSYHIFVPFCLSVRVKECETGSLQERKWGRRRKRERKRESEKIGSIPFWLVGWLVELCTVCKGTLELFSRNTEEEEDDDDDMMCTACYNKCGYMFLLHNSPFTPKIYSAAVYSKLCCFYGGYLLFKLCLCTEKSFKS